MAVPELEARRVALKASPLFQCLKPAELDLVLAHATTKRFARGSIILRKADPGTGMIVVISGRVRVGAISEEGKEITLAILGQGELLGSSRCSTARRAALTQLPWRSAWCFE